MKYAFKMMAVVLALGVLVLQGCQTVKYSKLSKSNSTEISVILEKSDKLGSLIKELTDDKDDDFKIIKVNTKGDKNG